MSQNSKSHSGPIGEKAEREARLAQALRTNLRRRKAAPAGADKGAVKPETPSQADESSSD